MNLPVNLFGEYTFALQTTSFHAIREIKSLLSFSFSILKCSFFNS